MMNTLRALGRDEQWSLYGTGGGYNDTLTIGRYKIEIENNENDTRFLIWDPKRPCVNMLFDKRERVGVLDSIRYDPDCTSPEQMTRGSETREMVDFSIGILKRNGATKVFLTDKSTIDCGGTDIELGPMYFLKYGKTWYETHFGFRPSAKFAAEYEDAKRQRVELLDTDFLSTQKCEFFDRETVRDIFRYIGFVNFYSIPWVKDLTNHT
jgi:hypothetical protein